MPYPLVEGCPVESRRITSVGSPHTWMFFPPGLSRRGDWPDLAACRAPSPLAVQYVRDDELFPLDGMMAAHKSLSASYRSAGRADAYVGQFFDGGHQFSQPMQESAFDQLRIWLTM